MVTLQKFNISYRFLQEGKAYRIFIAQRLAHQGARAKVRVPFSEGQNVHNFLIFDLVNFCYKLTMVNTKGLLAVLVQGEHLIIELLWANGQSLLALWGQSKISACCICDRSKSREIGGRGIPRLAPPMMESFSEDLLLTIKCYWTESSFKLCMLLGEWYTKLVYILPLLFDWGDKIDFFVYV